MARTRSAGAILLATLLSPAAASARPVLSIGMASDCSFNDTIVETVQQEATAVWSTADVQVQWVALDDLPFSSPRGEWLVVRCAPSEMTRPRSADSKVVPIAAIRFVGAQPTNTVVVSLDNAKTLLARDATESRGLSDRFAVLRDLRLGRMIGRAIAHEIGHFLNQSGAHTPTGLMKANHTLVDLIGKSLYPFRTDKPNGSGQQASAAPAALPR
jgi:hypothetical protein